MDCLFFVVVLVTLSKCLKRVPINPTPPDFLLRSPQMILQYHYYLLIKLSHVVMPINYSPIQFLQLLLLLLLLLYKQHFYQFQNHYNIRQNNQIHFAIVIVATPCTWTRSSIIKTNKYLLGNTDAILPVFKKYSKKSL